MIAERRQDEQRAADVRPNGSQVWSPDHASAAPLDHWSRLAESPVQEEVLPPPNPDPVSGAGSFSAADDAKRVQQTREPLTSPVPLRQNSSVTPSFVLHQKGPAATSSAIRMVNAGTFELEYDVEEVGPAGVSRVELWGTRDQGKTWVSFGTDPDNRSPINVAVNEEGIYGFQIVIEAANGLGGRPPQSGDAPDAWIGVDMTPPKARLVSAQQGTGNEADQLIIHWQATDYNMAKRGVSLLYSTSATGPWSTVAAGLENTGEYAWRLPHDMPDRFLLRLDVRDAADNLTTALSPQPVELKRPRPKGLIRGVHPVEQSAASQ